jgi:O-antigen/teichoic acid export membrane protein
MTWASILNSAGLRVPTLLFASFYGPTVAGWFFLTQKVLAIPITLIGKSVSQVFTGEAALLVRTDPIKLKKLFRKINLQLLLAGFVPCVTLALLGEVIFRVIFGVSWSESGKYAQSLAFVYLLKFCSESLINLALLEKQDLALLWGLIRLILVSSVIVSSSIGGCDGVIAVTLYSVAMIISYILNYIFWDLSLRSKIKKDSSIS